MLTYNTNSNTAPVCGGRAGNYHFKMKVCVTKKFSRMKSPSATPSFYYGGQAGEFIRYVAMSGKK